MVDLGGLYDEASDVVSSNRAASSETETAIRSNPLTGVPALVSDATSGGPQNTLQDETVDLLFQRPEELGLGSEDSQDLPLGSFMNPATDEDFESPTVGPDPWEGVPGFIPGLINDIGGTQILLAIGVLVLLVLLAPYAELGAAAVGD